MKKTAVNLVSVIGGEVLLRAANFAAVVVIARLFGPLILGSYATVLAFVTVAVMIADNGLQVSSIAEVAQKPADLGRTLGQLYVLKTALFSAMAVVLLAIGFSVKFPAMIWLMGAFLALRTMLYSYCQLNAGVLKALDRMRFIGMVQLGHCLLLLTGVGLAYYRSWNIYVLLGWLLLGQISELTASGLLVLHFGARPRWSPLSACWRILHRSTPIGITYSVAALILRADILVLSWIALPREVGYFAAANIPLVMVYVVAWLLGGVLLPKMVALSNDNQELRAYTLRWVRLLLLVTIPLSLVQLAITPSATSLIYGSGYRATGKLAAIMGLAVPFILANSIWLARALATESRAVYLGTYLSAGVAALLLDWALGRAYGGAGIASAIVIREVLMFAAFAIAGIRQAAKHSEDASVLLEQSLVPMAGE